MSNIIHQVCQQFITEIINFFKEGKATSLTEMELGLKDRADKFLKNMVKTYLEEIDRQIAEDKVGRKQKGLIVERRNEERTIYTRFGGLTYSRSYYFDKTKEAYLHPVDMVAGLEGYERVSLTVAANMVGHAVESSYEESSRHITGGDLSRQTVMKKIRKVHGLKVPVPQEQRVVKVLHVDADEDHVALQDGSTAIVPIVTVHEGIKKLYRSRNRCVNAHHVCCYGKSPEDLWWEVFDWIYDAYNTDKLETIYIHGDGANWIKKGLAILPKSEFVLDKYHLNKAIMNCTGAQPEYRKALRQVLKEADKRVFKEIVKKMTMKAGSENEKKRIKEFRRYILNNWMGIEIHKTGKCGGSSAEAHVSHVISARMSSRPMGWSREGVKHMAELRAFCANGGVVGVEHVRVQEPVSNLVKNAMKRARRVFHGINLETLGNVTSLNLGKVTPLFRVLRSIQYDNLIT